MPRLVKVGQSSHDPELRANELFTTGLPAPFHIEYKGLFKDYAQLERAVHANLSDYRLNNNREFFEVEPHVAIAAIISCSQSPPLTQILSDSVKKPIRELATPFSLNINWGESNETKTVSFSCKHCSSFSEHRVNKRMRSSICSTCGWKSEYN